MRFIADGKPVLAMAGFLAATSPNTHAFAAPKTEVGTLTRISVSAAGAQGNNNSYGVAWSPDSKSVVFYTQATNLFPTPDPNQATYVAQVTLGTGQVTDLTIGTPTGLKGASTYTGCTLCQTHPEFSADGQWLTFYAQRANGLSSLDTSGKFSIYVRNMTSGTSQLVSLAANGAAANASAYFPQMAPAGTFVVFSSDATNMVAGRNTRARGLYTYTLATGTTAPLTSATGAYPNGGLAEPVISADGTQLAFSSNATNFAAMPAGSTNVLVKSFATGAVTVASSSAAGVGGQRPVHPSAMVFDRGLSRLPDQRHQPGRRRQDPAGVCKGHAARRHVGDHGLHRRPGKSRQRVVLTRGVVAGLHPAGDGYRGDQLCGQFAGGGRSRSR